MTDAGNDPEAGAETKVPTYGEKAVGLSFNPSANPAVTTIKAAYAAIIDELDDARTAAKNDSSVDQSETIRLFSVAITEAQTAQMWAVKAITWVKA